MIRRDVRVPLAFAGVIVAVVAACSAVSEGENAGFGFDGGAIGVNGAPAGPEDSATESGSGSGSSGGSSGAGDSGGEVSPTSILAVHASANLYDFRLCFGLSGGGVLPVPAYPDDPAEPMPETNYPGVPVGGAVLLPALAIASGPVTPYLVRAQNLEKYGDVSTNPNEPTCDELICPGASCLTLNSDYVALPPVTLPSLGGTVVLAVEGCLAQGVASGSTAQCGSTYSAATGNLTAFAGALAAPDDAGSWSIQVAQLSPSFAQAADAAALTYLDPTIDASVALTASASSVGTPRTVPLSEAGVTAAYFVVNQSAPMTQSLAAIQYFQAPASDPFMYFGSPTTYFVAVVGDATDAAAPASLPDGAANPAFDGHGLHVIAYPESGN